MHLSRGIWGGKYSQAIDLKGERRGRLIRSLDCRMWRNGMSGLCSSLSVVKESLLREKHVREGEKVAGRICQWGISGMGIAVRLTGRKWYHEVRIWWFTVTDKQNDGAQQLQFGADRAENLRSLRSPARLKVGRIHFRSQRQRWWMVITGISLSCLGLGLTCSPDSNIPLETTAAYRNLKAST